MISRMLTLVPGQVNSVVMVEIKSQHPTTQAAPQLLASELLQPLMAKRRPERVLILKRAGADDLVLEPVGRVQIIRLSTDPAAAESTVRCWLGALPFAEEAFDLVILHQLVSDGDEPVMRSALQVLVTGGDLVISGLNSAGLQYRIKNREDQFPGLKINRVIEHLKSESFKIEHCFRMGLAGLSRPAPKTCWQGNGWSGLAMPFADHVMLHGHHQSNIQNASILRFKQAKRSRVASAALDGVSSRKAAS
jgi:SAM-dependent methyltransferase